MPKQHSKPTPQVGKLVKVHLPLDPTVEGCAGESPWVECVHVYEDGTWDGRVDNHPCFTGEHGIKAHDIVRFDVVGYDQGWDWQPIGNTRD